MHLSTASQNHQTTWKSFANANVSVYRKVAAVQEGWNKWTKTAVETILFTAKF